jgi:peptidoglycan/LPS O-acetylase OafA/YrhL
VGLLRLLLAIMVLISHTALGLRDFNLGAAAVVSFMILSGYVMTRLVTRHYRSAARVPLFYLDRAARIFPQFLFYLSATIVLVSQNRIAFGFAHACGPYDAALNAMALPLSWSNVIGLHCQYLPQAWSLGLEISFYLVVPFIVFSPRLAPLAAAVSLATAVAALAALIDTDTYAYRTLPGTLFIFMVGMSFAGGSVLTRNFPVLVWIGSAMLTGVLFLQHRLFAAPYGGEILVGLLVGIPLVAHFRDRPATRFDELMGNTSYGVFLNHLLIMNALEQIVGLRIDSGATLLVLIGLSTAAAFATYSLVELPVLGFRKSLRGNVVRAGADGVVGR